MEEAHGLFTPALSAVNKAQICDDLSLVLFVTEFSEHDERLLELLKRCCFGAPVSESQGEAVERQRLGVLVAEVANDRERDPVLFDCLFGVACASKLRSALVEAERVAPPVARIPKRGEPPAGLKTLRRERRQAVRGGCIASTAANQ